MPGPVAAGIGNGQRDPSHHWNGRACVKKVSRAPELAGPYHRPRGEPARPQVSRPDVTALATPGAVAAESRTGFEVTPVRPVITAQDHHSGGRLRSNASRSGFAPRPAGRRTRCLIKREREAAHRRVLDRLVRGRRRS